MTFRFLCHQQGYDVPHHKSWQERQRHPKTHIPALPLKCLQRFCLVDTLSVFCIKLYAFIPYLYIYITYLTDLSRYLLCFQETNELLLFPLSPPLWALKNLNFMPFKVDFSVSLYILLSLDGNLSTTKACG